MTKIIQRHDTSTNWTSVNPVLALGEMGIETDTNKFKFGDGVTEWTSLDYASAEGGGSADLSDYYTKEETYNQEEVDNLLDEKQNVFTTNIPLELSQTTYSNQNKMYYSDGTASVTSNTYSAKYYNRFTYSQIMSVGATASVDLKVYTCTIGSGSAPSNYQTISRDGDVNYISYPFSFTTGKEIIFPANYTLGYFDVDGVFNSIITNYYGSGSTGSINYWYTMMATDVNGVKHDSSVTTGQYKVIGRATGNNAGITPLASAEKVAYSLSCPSLTPGSTLTIKTYVNYGLENQTVTTDTLSLTSDVITALSKITVGLAQPLGNLYPNSSYTQGPIKDGNGNILYNTDSGSYTEESLKLHIDNQTIQVNANGELVANLDELGNEVNTLSGRVATVETNMGGVKIQKITQAEYDVLDPKDANTMYLIVG